MTSEEAIKTLKGEAWICCQEKYLEALDMAIEALKAEPYKMKGGKANENKSQQNIMLVR